MRTVAFILLLISTFFSDAFAVPTASPKKLSLDDSYLLAVERAEGLKISESSIREAEGRYREAVSAIYPQIGVRASEEIRDTWNDSSGSDSNSRRGGNERSRFLAGITARQPIFSGFRDRLLIEASEKEISALKLDTARARELLYQEVGELFFQILFTQKDLAELGANSKVLSERVRDLEQFVSLGKARQSELLSAHSDLSENDAARVQSEGLLAASLEMFSFLIGIPRGDFTLKEEKPNFIRESLETYLVRMTSRADLEASAAREVSRARQRKAAGREGWPVISLEGSYDPVDAPSGEQTGSLLLSMEMPLFDGGRISSRVAQQDAALEASRLQSEELKRRGERDIRVAYAKLVASESEVAKLQAHVTAAQRAYEAQKADYALGVVNNLDVLQAIRTLQEAKRRSLRARYDVYANQVALKVAVGGVSK